MENKIMSYAGIGTRDITLEERATIIAIAKKLSDLTYIVYSGNAGGSDISFQLGSNGRCVLFLPWFKFNYNNFEPTESNHKDSYVVGTKSDGLKSVNEFHSRPKSLSDGARMLMARNYYQVYGYGDYPVVDFVLCCADQNNIGNVKGGTGQAVRIAKAANIPVINIRTPDWEDTLDEIIYPLF